MGATDLTKLTDEELTTARVAVLEIVDSLNVQLTRKRSELSSLNLEAGRRKIKAAIEMPTRVEVNYTDEDRSRAAARVTKHADGMFTISDWGTRTFESYETALNMASYLEQSYRLQREIPKIFPVGATVQLGKGAGRWLVVGNGNGDGGMDLKSKSTAGSSGRGKRRWIPRHEIGNITRIDEGAS